VRLLIIKPSSLGDIVHSFPAVTALKHCLPASRICWVANDNLAALVELLPEVDRVIEYPRQQFSRCNLRAIKNFWRDLRSEQYDVAIDFQGLLRSGLIARASGAARRLGFAGAREGATLFYTEKFLPPPALKHAAEKNLALVQHFFSCPTPPPAAALAVPAEWQAAADALLPPNGQELLAVGFSSRWESKNWDCQFFASVLLLVLAQRPGLRCWLLGSAAERARGDEILSLLSGHPAVINLAGRTSLSSLTGLLRRSQALLTNDSGPMHIAAALGTPCIALFGATDPELTGPYGENRHQVFRSLCPDSPCFLRRCPRELCSAGIAPQDVADAILARLSGASPVA
jgi:lipopolysaccharide heptosyltransferase I